MANQEHLAILKQGVKTWNLWRKVPNSPIIPDLNSVDLRGVDLSGADLNRVRLRRTSLREANLSFANLFAADLSFADLREANLMAANLGSATLFSVNLHSTILRGASFNRARLWNTYFSNVDLSEVKELDSAKHHGPSEISISSIYRSQGKIPESFLKGAGLDDTFITYIRSLVGKPFEYYSCFISYSSKDEAFAKRLYSDLQSHNIRCWFAPEDMKTGDEIRSRIDEAIRIHDKLLLVLSY